MSNLSASHHVLGFGTMSLCITEDRPSESESIAMIEQLIDEEGLTFIDTADAYCLNEEEFGYGDRIVAKFVNDSRVTIATKGGFTRPGGIWKPKGDPAYLRSACEASLRRLQVEAIDLYQYHTPDKEVPYADSLGELVRLREEGKIKNIGVSNASLEQLTLAKEMADVRSIQNGLSILFYNSDTFDPLFRYCEANDILFIAYAPLGGHRNPYIVPTLTPDFNAYAERLGMTPYQLALLTLRSLSNSIVPITGSKSKQHVIENLAIRKLSLSAEDVEQVYAILDKAFGE